MTGVRESKKNDTVDLTCAGNTVRFVTLGREFNADAVIAEKGQARLPLALFVRIGEIAQTYKKSPIRIRIEKGSIRIQTMSLKDDAVTVGKITDRPIDIPDDASPLDLLAVKLLFSAAELRQSDLATRIAVAVTQRSYELKHAAEALEKYGISAATLEEMVLESIKGNAKTLRSILKPTIGSKQIQ